MEIYSIGFTKKTARQFFEAIRDAGVRRLIDVRLNNTSQLAGFAKRDDLEFFLEEICRAGYVHVPMLAPTQEMLDAYKKGGETWDQYEDRFIDLIREREIERHLDRALFDVPAVLLCSEATPEHCHRRLVLDYLSEKWGDLTIAHL